MPLTQLAAQLIRATADLVERLAIGAVTEAEARSELARLLQDASVGIRTMARRAEDEQRQQEEGR